jgi:hypothetical protein
MGVVYFLFDECKAIDSTDSPLQVRLTDDQILGLRAACKDFNVPYDAVADGLVLHNWIQPTPLMFFVSLPIPLQDFLSDECGATDDTNTPLHSPVTDAQLASLRALCTASKVNPDTIIDGLLFHGWIVISKVGGASSRPHRTRKANRRLTRMTRRL